MSALLQFLNEPWFWIAVLAGALAVRAVRQESLRRGAFRSHEEIDFATAFMAL